MLAHGCQFLFAYKSHAPDGAIHLGTNQANNEVGIGFALTQRVVGHARDPCWKFGRVKIVHAGAESGGKRNTALYGQLTKLAQHLNQSTRRIHGPFLSSMVFSRYRANSYGDGVAAN